MKIGVNERNQELMKKIAKNLKTKKFWMEEVDNIKNILHIINIMWCQ